MDKMAYPRGLIRYSTQNALTQHTGVGTIARRVLRPRTIVYSAILLAVIAGAGTGLWLRVPLKVDVIRDRGMLVREVEGGELENVYRLQVMNATEASRRYRITVHGVPGLHVATDPEFTLDAADTHMIVLRLRAPSEGLAPGSHRALIEVEALDGAHEYVVEKTVFLVR